MKVTVSAATAVAVLVAAPLAAAAPEPASVGAAPAAAAPRAGVAKAHRGKRRSARCHLAHGAEVVTKTKQVLVYETSQQNRFYCARPNGRRILIGRSNSEADEFVLFVADHVRVAGAFVAYRSAAMVNSMVSQAPFGPSFNLVGPRGNVVTGLSVGPDDGVLFPTADGGLVWLVGSGDMAQLRATGGPYGDPGPPPPPLGPETRGRVLDTGAIDPASVQVTGNTVTWVNAGVAKTFTPGA